MISSIQVRNCITLAILSVCAASFTTASAEEDYYYKSPYGDVKLWSYARTKRSEIDSPANYYSTGHYGYQNYKTYGDGTTFRHLGRTYKQKQVEKVPIESGSDFASSISYEAPQSAPYQLVSHKGEDLPVKVVVHHHQLPPIYAESVVHPPSPNDAAKIEAFKQNDGSHVALNVHNVAKFEGFKQNDGSHVALNVHSGLYSDHTGNIDYTRSKIQTQAEFPVAAPEHDKIVEETEPVGQKIVHHHHFHPPILAQDVQHPLNPNDQGKFDRYNSKDSRQVAPNTEIVEHNPRLEQYSNREPIAIVEQNEDKVTATAPGYEAPIQTKQINPIGIIDINQQHQQPYPQVLQHMAAPVYLNGGGLYIAMPNMHFGHLYGLYPYPVQQFNSVQNQHLNFPTVQN